MSLSTLLVDARKAAAAAAGIVAQVVELGLLHGAALHYAQVASAVLTTALVYLTPNGDSTLEGDGTVPAIEDDAAPAAP